MLLQELEVCFSVIKCYSHRINWVWSIWQKDSCKGSAHETPCSNLGFIYWVFFEAVLNPVTIFFVIFKIRKETRRSLPQVFSSLREWAFLLSRRQHKWNNVWRNAFLSQYAEDKLLSFANSWYSTRFKRESVWGPNENPCVTSHERTDWNSWVLVICFYLSRGVHFKYIPLYEIQQS